MKLLFALGLMPSLLLLVAGCSGEEKKPAATASGSQTTQTTLHSFPPARTVTAGPTRTTTPAPAPTALAIGQEATTAAGTTVTVYAYEQPAVSDDQILQPDPGNEYAIADVGGCASPSATKTSYFSSGFFELQMPDDTRRQNTISVREPALHTANLSAGDCLRGWLTFQVPIGTRPKFIIASDFINSGSSLKWIP